MITLHVLDPRRVTEDRVASLTRWLDAAERQRASEISHSETRHVHACTRLLVRQVLGSALDCDPASLRFARDVLGRPSLIDHPEIVFGVSNGPSLVVCSVGAHPHGLDAEPIARATALLGMEDTVFSDDERRFLEQTSDREKAAATLWTLKEAYLKARGIGLRVDPRAASFAIAGDEITVAPTPPLSDDREQWVFTTREHDTHIVAIASTPAESVASDLVIVPLPDRP